ncbi:hypothetical protein [Streptomyces sp. NPDC127595]
MPQSGTLILIMSIAVLAPLLSHGIGSRSRSSWCEEERDRDRDEVRARG